MPQDPGGKAHRPELRFQMPRRRVDEQPVDLAIGKRRQLACEVVEVGIVAEDGAIDSRRALRANDKKSVAQQDFNFVIVGFPLFS